MTDTNVRAAVAALAAERILVLDGPLGTEIQKLGLSDEQFRGERFADHAHDLSGNNELVALTQPDALRTIHLRYCEAGADIIETNTFNGQSISQSDYGLEHYAFELNKQAAILARRATDKVS